MTDVSGSLSSEAVSGEISSVSLFGSIEQVSLTGTVSTTSLSGTITEETLTGTLGTGEVLNGYDYVPYLGAERDVDLGSYNLETTGTLTGDELIASTGITLNGVRITNWSTNAIWGAITGTLSDQTDLQSALDGKENALGYTPENVTNKDTSSTLGTSDTKYPSQYAVKQYVDNLVNDLNLELNEVFTLTATDISNKYVQLAGTITDNQSVLVIVSDIGLIAEVGVDYSISDNYIYWTGYSFATKLEEGEKIKIYYK
ncbi:MAG TPA: hypothetical protein PL042_01640 [Caldisericia bacterium]|nr:hypothetical protein [Caldisericia bacterium]